VAADTAVESAHRPLRSGCSLLTESEDLLASAGRHLVARPLALWHTPPPPSPCTGTLDAGALETDLQRLTRSELQPAAIQLYPDGPEALVAVLHLIDAATERLDVLMFLWDNDPVGWAVATRLAAKAGPDLPVRVLVDGGGNLVFGQPRTAPSERVNQVVCWLSRQPYVQVLRTRDAFARFDHRKLVLADGRAAWLGGRNFTAVSFFGQHDLSFTLQGPLTHELVTLFEASWREQGGRGQGTGDRGQEAQGSEATAPCSTGTSPLSPVPCSLSTPNAWARLVATGPGDRELARAVCCAVDRARQHIFVENPYFSDSRLIDKLLAARQRGVDVEAVLTIESDNSIFNRTNRVTANRLLRAGARVYLHPGMTHVKALAADGCWAYTGSGNFDPLSLRHDREVGVAVSAGPVIAELEERLFMPDCRPEWELHQPLPVTARDCALAWLAGLLL
jgi:cardiolipin synthase